MTTAGTPEPGCGTVPGTTLSDLGTDPDQYNPFGMAFAPDGTLYFVDIHVTCKGPLTGCGPADYGGRVMTRDLHQRPAGDAGHGGRRLRLPDQRDGVRAGQAALCPYPTGKIVAPLSGPSENPLPTRGRRRTPLHPPGSAEPVWRWGPARGAPVWRPVALAVAALVVVSVAGGGAGGAAGGEAQRAWRAAGVAAPVSRGTGRDTATTPNTPSTAGPR